MRSIDINTWSRREQYRFLKDWDYPHFNICANVDLSAFHLYVKERGISFNVAIIYVLARAANTITEFRYRIRGEEVIEHEVIHPASTILTDDELYSFCTFDYEVNFPSGSLPPSPGRWSGG